MATTLTHSQLRDAIAGDGIGLRARIALEPLGGSGDKIFPASYGTGPAADSKYAMEKRRVDGATVDAVLLNSVAAEANRIELALLDAYRDGELAIPVVSVDFAAHGLSDLGVLSAYEVSHRIYDAAIRDSMLGDVLFRLSDVGRAVTEATPKSATALFRYSPASLLLGAWDSTGPRGGRGSKFERALTSEIVGLGAVRGVKVGSRIDMLAIEKGTAIYEATDPREGWTLDEAKAVKDKGKPKLFSRTGTEGKAGDPSHVNHGNVLPSLDEKAGGVTVDTAIQIVVLSFGALRKFKFPTATNGDAIEGTERTVAETAARTALAALGIAGIALAYEGDYDLRSRCVLHPVEPLTFELMRRGVRDSETITIDRDGALALLGEASAAAAAAGVAWLTDELVLQPSERLVTLIKKSREL